MGILRALIVVFWSAVGTALLLDLPAPVDRLLVIAGAVVAVLHVLELAGFVAWRRKRGPLAGADIILTLVFGVVHLKPRMAALRRASGNA